MILYHGTTRAAAKKIAADGWRDSDVYLTPDRREALGYGAGVHLGGAGDDTGPVLLRVQLPKNYAGKTLYAHDAVDDAIFEDDSVKAIDEIMSDARRCGFRFVRFIHPNAIIEGTHIVYVSLYPSEDLTIVGMGAGRRSRVMRKVLR